MFWSGNANANASHACLNTGTLAGKGFYDNTKRTTTPNAA
jgi:hypothetical protein